MSWIPERDANGFALFKNQICDSGWHYEPRSFDWFCGKLNSLYNRKETGNGSIASADDYEDAVMKFYNSSGEELIQGESESDEDFQTRLDSNCYLTDVIWTPDYDRKCIGANFQVINIPSISMYLWTYVDLSALELDNIPYVQGGLNLRFLPEGHPYIIDGRTVSDEALPAYIPIIFRVRHDLVNDTTRPGIQVFLEHYRS